MPTLIHDAHYESAGDPHMADRRDHHTASSSPDPVVRRQHRMQHEIDIYGVERRTSMIKLDYLLAAVLLLVLFLVWTHQ